MASIVPYKDGWRAVIRRTGYKYRSKTFDNYVDAEVWARGIEVEMDTKTYITPTGTKVGEVFRRYALEVSPTKGGARWEVVRINKFLTTIQWMTKPIEDLDRFDIQAWRDQRVKEVSGASVNREMNLISGVLQHAMQEWGVTLRTNPVREVKRPPKGKARNRRVTSAEEKTLDKAFNFTLDRVPKWGKMGGR